MTDSSGVWFGKKIFTPIIDFLQFLLQSGWHNRISVKESTFCIEGYADESAVRQSERGEREQQHCWVS